MSSPLLLALVVCGQGSAKILDYVPAGLRSAEFTAKKVLGNQRELSKINEDFGMSYRFVSTKVTLKEPFKLRLEGKVEDTSMLFITNGTKKMFKAPRSKISIKEDTSRAPGKRQTIMDFGLLAPSLFSDLFDANFVRKDREGFMVFDLTYKPSLKDGTRHRVWIQPDTKALVKREWYSQIDKRLMATFQYSAFKNIDGVNFPTRYEVRNADNVVAGSIRYESIRVNVPIEDSLFAIN